MERMQEVTKIMVRMQEPPMEIIRNNGDYSGTP